MVVFKPIFVFNYQFRRFHFVTCRLAFYTRLCAHTKFLLQLTRPSSSLCRTQSAPLRLINSSKIKKEKTYFETTSGNLKKSLKIHQVFSVGQSSLTMWFIYANHAIAEKENLISSSWITCSESNWLYIPLSIVCCKMYHNTLSLSLSVSLHVTPYHFFLIISFFFCHCSRNLVF